MHSARRTAAVLIALALATPLWAGDPNQEVFEKAYSMEGISRISVENVNGNIAATAWDKPYFKLRATKRVEGGHADETLRLTEIRVEKVGNEIKVETVNPKRRRLFGFLDFGSSGAHVDYELQIPSKTDVRFETSNGKLVANGFAGTIAGDAVNGLIFYGAAAAIGLAATLVGILVPSLTCLYAVAMGILALLYVSIVILAIVIALGGGRLLIPIVSSHASRRVPAAEA